MKARRKFDKAVAASNERLTAISDKAIKWAVGNVVEHIVFRTSNHKCTCGDCGHKFDYEGKGKSVRCPHCGRRSQILDTLIRKKKTASYFSTLEVVDSLQVQRVFLLKVCYWKGKPMETDVREICRLWLNAKGQTALTSRQRTPGYYVDSFSMVSGIELRTLRDVHQVISDTYVYPRYSVIPELRRNGMKGWLPNCHPFRLMQALLKDHRIETMMKAKDYKAVEHFICHPLDLELCWQPYKIATRHQYKPADYSLWCDTVRLLEKCGKDIHSVKYICPDNLKTAHDHWLAKMNRMEDKRRDEERMQRAKAQEADFYREKSCFFGIVIREGDIEISVLNSLEAYKAEGDFLHHCVFQCEYYAKSDSVILSAHDLSGNRYETVEFSILKQAVVQSRGLCNKNTEYHDKIIQMVNANAHRFLEAKASASA